MVYLDAWKTDVTLRGLLYRLWVPKWEFIKCLNLRQKKSPHEAGISGIGGLM